MKRRRRGELGSEDGRRKGEITAAWHEYAPDLHAHAMSRLGGQKEDAYEVVQETFHDAIRRWSIFRTLPKDEQRAWLFMVLKRRIIDVWRRGRRDRDRVVALSAQLPADAQEDDYQTGDEALMRRFAEIMARFGPRRRAVFIMHWEEKTTAEIAKILGITESTVRTHLSIARLELRKELGPDFDPDFDPEDDEGGNR